MKVYDKNIDKLLETFMEFVSELNPRTFADGITCQAEKFKSGLESAS